MRDMSFYVNAIKRMLVFDYNLGGKFSERRRLSCSRAKNGVEAQNETEVAGQKESRGMPFLCLLANFMSSGRNVHGTGVQNRVF